MRHKKIWLASPYLDMVLMSEAGMAGVKAYEKVSHAYDANMPADALTAFRYTMIKTRAYGLEKAATAEWQ